ncbi:MAG: hypothetical protein AB7H80_08385 [Candidatus Kapaibacterium sp.]
MSGTLWLFSSDLERNAAFPDGLPDGVTTAITGVGLVDAGIGTCKAILEQRPERLIFFGTCGAYPASGLKIGEIISATTLSLGSGDTSRGEMRIPGLLPAEVEVGAGELRELKNARVVCTLGVTENDALALLLGREGDVENLELFSVARAAGDIPVTGLLGVTNIVGANGGREWRENYRSVMRSLVMYLGR